MTRPTVAPLTPSLKAGLPQFAKDLRAAFSYVSFYSMDSPFVTQAIKKLHQGFSLFLSRRTPLLFARERGGVLLNGSPLPESEAFAKMLESHSCPGVMFLKGADFAALVTFLRKTASPSDRAADLKEEMRTNDLLRNVVWADEGAYEIRSATEEEEGEEAAALPSLSVPPAAEVPGTAPPPVPVILQMAPPVPVVPRAEAPGEPVRPDTLRFDRMEAELTARDRSGVLLELLAEAWQYSQLLKRHKYSHPEADPIDRAFDRLFRRMLTKLEGVSPEFGSIQEWFSTPEGEALPERVALSMVPLMETALRNGWTSVMCDPSTEGLVTDCLAEWGANGKHELVERAVTALSESLLRPGEKRLALSHLRDSRPWIRNTPLVATVLRRLVRAVAEEWEPATYQTALLLAWDLMEPAIEGLKSEPDAVLSLVATLQLHAEDETPPFRDRPVIARHWLFERTRPETMSRLVMMAKEAGILRQFSVLGMAAAPLLLKEFYGTTGPDRQRYLEVFRELKEAVQAVVIEALPEMQDEAEVRQILPVIRAAGLDPSLSMQLSTWAARGSRELRMNIIGTITELGDAAGGPALRMAVLDDDEDVALAAVEALGSIRFTAAGPLLVRAAQIRRKQHPGHERFLAAVCRLLGEWAQPESVPFLMETAQKKPLLSLAGAGSPLPVRLAAIRALGQFNSPEVWTFIERLSQEKSPELQEALHELIEKRISGG
jgi:hypothetical protein